MALATLRGVDLNHRPLGYESAHKRIFSKLANADGPAKPRAEAQGIVIEPVMDLRFKPDCLAFRTSWRMHVRPSGFSPAVFQNGIGFRVADHPAREIAGDLFVEGFDSSLLIRVEDVVLRLHGRMT